MYIKQQKMDVKKADLKVELSKITSKLEAYTKPRKAVKDLETF